MKVTLFSDTLSPQMNGVTNNLDKLAGYTECRIVLPNIFRISQVLSD